jgi:glutamate-1-semialdehyde aminotransferase
VRSLYHTIPFNHAERSAELIRKAGDRLAAVVIEPVIDAPPETEWLRAIRTETSRVDALLIFDEIKTAFRVGPGSAADRWGGEPDLIVLGKALANGYPLAAVGGPDRLLERVRDTWISSTMATEFVSLAAARATLRVMEESALSGHLERIGTGLYQGLNRLAGEFPHRVVVSGIPQMCYLRYRDEDLGRKAAVECARRGLLFKRNAYNFVSLAHGEAEVETALTILQEVLKELA